MPRRTRSTAAKENAAANNASSEQPPDPPKNPEAKEKTAANARSLPQALKPFGKLSDDEMRKGIEAEGDDFIIQRYRDSVDDIEKWFLNNLGCRVTAQEVDGKLVEKLRLALRMKGLGVGINGEDIAVTTKDIKKDATSVEQHAYYKSRIRFAPTKNATDEEVEGELIEFLTSSANGEDRFFVSQGIESLNELHGELSGKGKPSKYKELGRLVRALRKLKNYSHNNYQPTQQDNLLPPQDVSMNNRAAAAAAGADAAAGGAATMRMPPLNSNEVPAPPRGGNELANTQNQVTDVNQDFARPEELQLMRNRDQEQQDQQNRINQGMLDQLGVLQRNDRDLQREMQQMQQDRIYDRDNQNQINEGMLDRIGDLQRGQGELERSMQDVRSVQADQGREIQDVRSVQADQGGQIQDVRSVQAEHSLQIAKSAKKADRMVRAVKAAFDGIGMGVKIDLSSPGSMASNDESVDFTPNFGRQQTEANDTNSTALSRSRVLDFSENGAGNESPTGNTLEDSRNEEDLSLPRLLLLDTFRKCGLCADYLQNTSASDNSVDIVKRVVPDVIRVCKKDSGYSPQLKAEVLVGALNMFQRAMEEVDDDETPQGLMMKNQVKKSYIELGAQLNEYGGGLKEMVDALESETSDYIGGICAYLWKMIHKWPITLGVPGEGEFVDDDKAKQLVTEWTGQLTNYRQEVQKILGDAATESELGNVVLCNWIRLSDKSFSDEAADVIATFLKEPFMGGRSIASGILYAELDDDDVIAGRMADMGPYFGDNLEEMKENDSDGEADDDLSDDDSDEAADDVPDVADDNVPPDVAGDNAPPEDVDSFLADRMSRLSMMSS